MSAGTGTIRVVRSVAEFEGVREEMRSGDGLVGFVPTMGYLHEGHAALLRAARAECDLVVLSIFVNPKQFDRESDLDSYPRDEGRDLDLAVEEGVDFVLSPPVEELYPEEFATTVEVAGLTDVLCGSEDSRGTGHFRGVTTVVALLLNLVDPDIAYFGQKDAQQVAVVRRMVSDLRFRARISVVPTVREGDGLARSSRNARLSESGRRTAAVVPLALQKARDVALSEGVEAGLAAGREILVEAGLAPEYFEARTVSDLRTVDQVADEDWMVAVAVEVDGVRLIDNLPVEAGR
jgi:pantoate--beta-alanine ligase